MTYSKKEAEVNDLLKISRQPALRTPPLVVGWSTDAGKLGAKVTDYLLKKLGCERFGEINPVEFYPLNGVVIEDDLVQFPRSQFYACPEHDLAIFKSYPPNSEWYKFLTLLLDVAQHDCHLKELYVIGGMVSLGAHTAPRQIMGTCNTIEMKNELSPYDVTSEMDFQTSGGQKPTLNSFLLWAARRRGIPAISLWVPIPFYLVNTGDCRAQKKVIEFFDQRFHLGIDMGDLDESIRRQNVKIADLRAQRPEIDEYIGKLESSLKLTDEENQKIIDVMEEYLG